MTDSVKQKTALLIAYLQCARIAREQSEQQLAQKLHISKIDYVKLESGEIPLTVEHFFQIADVLEFDVLELLDAALWCYSKYDTPE